MVITVDDRKLKSLIKESVQEVLQKELIKFRAFALREASQSEQKDIEKQYGKPLRKPAKSYTLEV